MGDNVVMHSSDRGDLDGEIVELEADHDLLARAAQASLVNGFGVNSASSVKLFIASSCHTARFERCALVPI